MNVGSSSHICEYTAKIMTFIDNLLGAVEPTFNFDLDHFGVLNVEIG